MDCLVLKTVIFPFLTEQKKIKGKGDRKRGQDRAVRTGQSGGFYAAKLLARLPAALQLLAGQTRRTLC
jgi:hypothetical protein